VIAASGTGVGHVTIQHVPTLPGALNMKNEADNITTYLIIIAEKPVFKAILYLFTWA